MIYFGKDAIDKVFNEIIRGTKQCYKVIKLNFRKLTMKILKILLNIGFIKRHMKKVK